MSVRIHKNTAKVDCRWVIGLLFAEGIAYVTKIENYPEKCFYWESGKNLSILKVRELLMIMLLACPEWLPCCSHGSTKGNHNKQYKKIKEGARK